MAPLEDKSNVPIKFPRKQSAVNLISASASNSERTVTYKNSEESDETDASSSSSVAKETKKNGTRAQPKRQCKEKGTIYAPTAIESNTAPKSKDKPKTDKKTKTSGKPAKKPKTKPLTRATRKRLLKSLKKAVKDAANAVRRPCLRVSRTVELVNQSDDSWREEKSKLLFMLSLGLTPILERPAISSTPIVKLSIIPKEKLPKARSRAERELAGISSQLKQQSIRKLWRERRAQIIRDRAQLISKSFSRPAEIEVIDLTECVKSQSQSSKKTEDSQSSFSFSSNFDDEVIILD